MPFKKGHKFGKGQKRGFQHTKESRNLISIKTKEAMKNMTQEAKKEMGAVHIGHIPWNKGMIGFKQSEEHRKNTSSGLIGHKVSQETRRRIGLKNSTLRKEYWEKKTQEERYLKMRQLLKGRFKRPTSLEKEFIGVIEKYNMPYRYVGDGSFLIGFKNPDFININGEKICIEVRNSNVCKFIDKISTEEYENRRKNHFAQYGWRCVVILEDQMDSDNLRSLGLI